MGGRVQRQLEGYEVSRDEPARNSWEIGRDHSTSVTAGPRRGGGKNPVEGETRITGTRGVSCGVKNSVCPGNEES